jgi:DNA-binding MarR family transcriptional regulator
VVRVLRVGSRDAEKRVGLSGAQLFVLQKLSETKVLSVNELAERTHTHQSSVSVVVQRLVERGLAARTRSRKDARQLQLSVTRAGRAVLRSAPAAAQEQLIEALGRMSDSNVAQLSTSLERLLDLLGIDASEPAAMLFEDDDEVHRAAAAKITTKKSPKGQADGGTRKRN